VVSIALIGPDGAGKTTLAKQLPAKLGLPAAYLYMGINLEASNVMLPTTRLALEMKRWLGGRPDLAGWGDVRRETGRPLRPVKTTVRVANLIAEEWFRQTMAWYHQLRGRVVVFDRHFFIDYHAYDVAHWRVRGQPIARRLHGLMLERLYPKPDIVILLDAPTETLRRRKGEGSMESIDRKRREYLAAGARLGRFEVVDASRPASSVLDEVTALVLRSIGRGG
jgi:thymidylate kinase